MLPFCCPIKGQYAILVLCCSVLSEGKDNAICHFAAVLSHALTRNPPQW